MTNRRQLGIDAHVILRYLVRDDEALYAKAAAIFKALAEKRAGVFCDPVILAEVVWVLASYYKIGRDKIADGLVPMLQEEGFIIPNKDRYIRALRLYAHAVPHFGDACACAMVIEDCEGKLLSFDRKLSAVKGISRVESVDN